MKVKKQKLRLEKFKISKLTNSTNIVGGNGYDGDGGETQTDNVKIGSSLPCLLTLQN